MPNVDFIIGNQSYSIACDSGEEEKIRNLAATLNARVKNVSKSFSTASSNFVIAITALLMEDEINMLKEQQTNNNTPNNNISTEERNELINRAIINTIEPITTSIETLAQKLENV